MSSLESGEVVPIPTLYSGPDNFCIFILSACKPPLNPIETLSDSALKYPSVSSSCINIEALFVVDLNLATVESLVSTCSLFRGFVIPLPIPTLPPFFM